MILVLTSDSIKITLFIGKLGLKGLSFAKKNKKPILLSIGYASCHWCHVMAHESFEDNETAKTMNQLFVNIKVDREERPDLIFFSKFISIIKSNWRRVAFNNVFR